MPATQTEQPTVYIVMGQSAVAYEETGEILEAVEFDQSGKPIWTNAGICDHRGAGGPEGFAKLAEALDAAEANARYCYEEIKRVPKQVGEGWAR